MSSKPEEQLAYELSCPICLHLYSDPVALPCGHNYCQACICKTIDSTEKSRDSVPRCPECREEYSGMDTLQINLKLRRIIENYRGTAPLLTMQADTVDSKAEVFCDYCIDEQSPAVKTCLKCEVSLCSRHFQKHQEKELSRKHTVVEPTTELGMKDCATHRRRLKYFCSNDTACLCTVCVVEGHHQNHDVLTIDAAEKEMRRALENRNKIISSRLQLTEGLLQEAAEEEGTSEATGDKMVSKAVAVMEDIVTLVHRYRDRLHLLLEEEIGHRKKCWQLDMNVIEQQQQQLLDAQQSATEVLSETDACVFIHRFMQIEQKMKNAATSNISSTIPPKAPFNMKRLETEDFCSEMTLLMYSLHILLNPLELIFNICTAHPSLLVSSDLRTVKYCSSKQSYPEHPDRFTSAPQILCSQGFSSGEHVWVVEVGANTMWSLGVCYKTIPRRGDHGRLGHNSVSWRLQWKNNKLTACHRSSNVALREVTTPPVKIEIALDYEEGTLMFHSTKADREHLHTFKAEFKETVYPAFAINSNIPDSWITLLSGS